MMTSEIGTTLFIYSDRYITWRFGNALKAVPFKTLKSTRVIYTLGSAMKVE